MKYLQNIGLALFLLGLTIFTSLIILGNYKLTPVVLDKVVKNKAIKSELFIEIVNNKIVNETFNEPFSFSAEIISAMEVANNAHKQNSEWNKIIWDKPNSFTYVFIKQAGQVSLRKINDCFGGLLLG